MAEDRKNGEPPRAYIVQGNGTDEVIADRCAKAIPDWQDKSEDVKAETIRLMRYFSELPHAPAMDVSEREGQTNISPHEGTDITLHVLRIVETFGSSSQSYVDQRIGEVAGHLKRIKGRAPTTQELETALAFIRGANATDTVQSSLAVQMFATHDAAMRALSRFETCESLETAKMFGNVSTKLLNAYTRQAETLAKLQRGGEQVIKHVHIDNRGGQAVVTDQVVTGGRETNVGDQSHAQSTRGTALLGHDPQGYGVPVPGGQGPKAVPDARWDQRRRA